MKKKIAIITGASSGFGVEFAIQLDKRFTLDEIWLIARREEKLEDTAKLLRNSQGIVMKSDLSNKEGLSRIKDLLASDQPDLKVLINNAGFGRTEAFMNSDDDYNENMIDVNVKATVLLSKIAIPYMSKGSFIMNVASSAAYAPLPYFSVYAATKAFVLSFSYSLKEELKSKGISITAMCPGPASTEFFKSVTDKKVNGIKIEDPKLIVKKGVTDLIKRRSVSIYGYEMNFLRVIAKLLPRKILTYLSGKVKLPE